MDATIYYYTGTGNSLWVARTIAEKMGGAGLIPMSRHGEGERTIDATVAGVVFPVHIWGVPAPVVRFVESLEGTESVYFFGIAVHAGQVSNTLVQLKKILSRRGIPLSLGCEVRMPSNYIPWGGPGPREKQLELFARARDKISGMSDMIRQRAIQPVEKGPLWQRIIFTPFYHLSLSSVPGMDKKFRADDRCNHCGICVRVCPASNITLSEGKPLWNHRCEQCFACLQWCPTEAIQYGTGTLRYERYHHPEIVVRDMLRSDE
jgi:ferredoxin